MSGVRPNHRHPVTGDFFPGVITFEDGTLKPGSTGKGTVRVMVLSHQLEALRLFRSWTIWAGPQRHVGTIRVIAEIDAD